MNNWQTCVGICQPSKTRALFIKWRTQVSTFKLIEKIHNCPAMRDISSIAYKDTKNKKTKNGGASGFFLNFFSPPLSVSYLLFFCFIVLRECHSTKSAMLQISVCCDLTRVWRVKAGTSLKTFWCFPRRVFQLKFAQ